MLYSDPFLYSNYCCSSSSPNPVQVYIGDKVVLTPVSTGQPLHVSDLSLPDHPDCREVNADPAG